jgi:hypothetical protein
MKLRDGTTLDAVMDPNLYVTLPLAVPVVGEADRLAANPPPADNERALKPYLFALLCRILGVRVMVLVVEVAPGVDRKYLVPARLAVEAEAAVIAAVANTAGLAVGAVEDRTPYTWQINAEVLVQVPYCQPWIGPVECALLNALGLKTTCAEFYGATYTVLAAHGEAVTACFDDCL